MYLRSGNAIVRINKIKQKIALKAVELFNTRIIGSSATTKFGVKLHLSYSVLSLIRNRKKNIKILLYLTKPTIPKTSMFLRKSLRLLVILTHHEKDLGKILATKSKSPIQCHVITCAMNAHFKKRFCA